MDKLDFAERLAREEQIQNTEVQASTVDWIWNINDPQKSFNQWLQSHEAIFWIQGKPGSGKSTLMSYLARKAKGVLNKASSSTKHPWTIAWFYFDFRAEKGVANNFEGLLRSLCLQVADALPKMGWGPEPISYTSLKSSNLTNLRQTLFELLNQTRDNLCVFVDGLDEYQGKVVELLEFLKTLPQKAQTGTLIKICLASRPEPVIALALKSNPGLSMQDHNARGIRHYVLSAIKNLELDPDDESQLSQLSSLIVEKAEGIFLWLVHF